MTRPLTKADIVVASCLFAGYLTALASTNDIGIPRDESFYFAAGELYSGWFDDLFDSKVRAFSRQVVDKRFEFNPEHPALPKILFGLSWRLLGKFNHDPSMRGMYLLNGPPREILGILDEIAAFRLPAWLMASLLVAWIYLFGAEFFNRRVGFVASLVWALMPRVFWHAHLACFDVPVTAMWFATSYAFLKAETRPGIRWPSICGLSFGLALSMKLNAYFLPPLFVLYFLLTRANQLKVGKSNGQPAIAIPSIPLSFFSMLFIGGVVYYVLWPKLWYDPIGHLKWYFGRHAHHEYYWAYYFGTLYTHPPFPMAFPFVMSAVSIPGPGLLLALVGLLRFGADSALSLVRRSTESHTHGRDRPTTRVLLFVFLNFLVPFAVIAHPQVPIFGGTKHWFPGVPYLALFAGYGFDWFTRSAGPALASWSSERPWPKLSVALCALLAVLGMTAATFDTFHGYRNASAYYNAFFGGYQGMGIHGMQREFWGNSAGYALEFVNRDAPHGARVDFHDTTWDAVRVYKRTGMLRPDIVPVWEPPQSDYYLFHWHKEFLDLEAQKKVDYGVFNPVHVVQQDGVPLLNVYRRRGLKPARGGRE